MSGCYGQWLTNDEMMLLADITGKQVTLKPFETEEKGILAEQ